MEDRVTTPGGGDPTAMDGGCAVDAELLAPGLLHELKQPLMGVRAGLTLVGAAMGPQLAENEEWALALAQLHRIEELVAAWSELLDPSGPRAGDLEVEPVVRRALDLLRFRTRALGPGFALAIDAPRVLARANPRALLHALTNLVVNAMDAVSDGGGGRIEVRLRHGELGPEVRVADDGTGVAPELRERIFDLRFTTKARGRGTGLGLPIARRVMEACGGSVRLVADGDAARRPWARAEFAIGLARAEGAR